MFHVHNALLTWFTILFLKMSEILIGLLKRTLVISLGIALLIVSAGVLLSFISR